jgi:hypothetical protein
MSWSHLIHFEHNGDVHYGDAVFPPGSDPNDVVALANDGKLKAHVVNGNPFTNSSIDLTRTLVVEKLLNPLGRSQVPIIRCIGLNYMKHSRVHPERDI